jgi:type I restriction enzyme R subunit
LKLKNTLKSFDEFSEEKAILTPRQFQDYNSYYQNIHEKTIKSNKENINEDLEFSIELIKQEDINIGFILELVLKYQKDQSEKNRNNITSAVASSPAFRNKRDLIDNFLEKINNNGKDDAYLH